MGSFDKLRHKNQEFFNILWQMQKCGQPEVAGDVTSSRNALHLVALYNFHRSGSERLENRYQHILLRR